jgi:hypothetical protein
MRMAPHMGRFHPTLRKPRARANARRTTVAFNIATEVVGMRATAATKASNIILDFHLVGRNTNWQNEQENIFCYLDCIALRANL